LRASFVLAVNRLDVGDLVGAQEVLVEALAEADRAGMASSLYGIEARSLLAQVQVVSGAWDRALATAGEERPHLPAREALFLTVPLLPVSAARTPSETLERVRALVECDPHYPIYWHVVLVPKADALIWMGQPQAALEAVRESLESFRAVGRPLIMGGLVAAAVGIAALADVVTEAAAGRRVDDAAQARAEAAELLEHARRVAVHGPSRLRTLGPEGRAWLLRAEAAATRLGVVGVGASPSAGTGVVDVLGPSAGVGAGDVAAWRAAHEAFGYGHVYESARTAWRLAEALLVRAHRSDRDEAVALIRSVREIAVRLGTRPLRDAVDALALRHGLDLGAGRAGQRLLTPRESEVIRLVAEGLTNREIGARLFISEKTASVHVSNMMAKLGASGRAEAVSLAHRRGLFGPQPALTVEV
jgi:DNA-binding CsgD family transcriptional regulator